MSRNDELRAMLRWQLEAGADEAVAPNPIDRFADPGPATRQKAAYAPSADMAPSPAPSPPPEPDTPTSRPTSGHSDSGHSVSGPATAKPTVRPTTTPAGTPAITPAGASAGHQATDLRTRLGAVHTLDGLREALHAFDGCALKETATHTVFADGNPKAALMLVGEAPGAEEDRQGLPFVGPAGHLLDKMLAAIGHDRSSVYITNMLAWRPPGNRNPTDAEIAACLPFIERHIELVQPKVLVFLGGIAAKTLLGRREGITKLRGRWYNYESVGMVRPIAARPCLHPAYLLRSPAQKRLAWRDLIEIKKELDHGGA